MTEREGSILKLLSWCLKNRCISGVDPRVPFRGKWARVREAGETPPAAVAAPEPSGPAERVTCRCGTCRRCVDNARWERIYREKFEDPDYYSDPVVRSRSPFADL
jgi:hypothetical protein